MSRKRQYGGQTTNNIATLEQIEKEKEEALIKAQQDYNAAQTNYAQTVETEAAKRSNYEIKVKNVLNAETDKLTKQSTRNKTKEIYNKAESDYKAIESTQQGYQSVVNAKQIAYNIKLKEESDAKKAYNDATIEVSKAAATRNMYNENIKKKEPALAAKRLSVNISERAEAKLYDPTFITGIYAWFDASKLQGANGTAITSWSSSPSSLGISIPSVKFEGSAFIGTNSTILPIVGVSATNSLIMNPAPLLETFTLFIVSRQTGGQNGRVLQGTGVNSTFGYINGKKDTFILGETSFSSETPSNTSWDLYTITRTPTTSGGFYKFGSPLLEFNSSRTPLSGLAINAGTAPNEKSVAEIAEIVLYQKGLTADEMRMIEGLLARKWGLTTGLPDNHPYKNKYPELLPPAGGRRHLKRRLRKLKRKTKKVRKGKGRHTRRR